MKLYAIRDKKTGWLLDYCQASNKWTLDTEVGVVWNDCKDNHQMAFMEYQAKVRSEQLNVDLEVITLRVEPTEPCEWCETYGGEMIAPSDDLYAFECALDAEDWSFCPNCGRRLGDE